MHIKVYFYVKGHLIEVNSAYIKRDNQRFSHKGGSIENFHKILPLVFFNSEYHANSIFHFRTNSIFDPLCQQAS